MSLINLADLKAMLSLQGVTYDLTDEQLTLLLNTTINELIGYTNAPINPVSHKTFVRDFSGDRFEVDHYPVKCVSSIQIDNGTLEESDYILDNDLGILYFNHVYFGMLVIEYVSEVSEATINNIVNPLITDMIAYRLTTDFSTDGVMSSVKEGDVQVNYDTSSSLGNLIQARIKDLKTNYSTRIKVL